jgi:UDP:flavonoid glycosyltransferase YjiC (YdhE family)
MLDCVFYKHSTNMKLFLVTLFVAWLPAVLTLKQPGTALFVNHVPGATEVNQMMMIADELVSRGHKAEFLVVEAYKKRVEKRGQKVVATFQSLDPDRTAQVFKIATQGDTFGSYVGEFYPAVINFYSDYYEPALQVLIKHLEEKGKPDCLISSMFSEMAIDASVHYDIPLSILYATPLGSLAGYEDHVAAPDTNFWAPVATHGSFGSRLYKLWSTIRLVMGILPAVGKTAAVREKYGLAPTAGPLDNWKRAAVFHTFSFGFEPARQVRPLTFTLGFLSKPYTEPKELSNTDQELKKQLSALKGGVVYAAFGSLAILTQEMFDNLVTGLDQWAQSREKAGAILALSQSAEIAAGLDTSHVPDTVTLTYWTNQEMILNHPNCKAFVTHAGQGSIAEAINAQVPMLAIPLFGDQPSNAHRIHEAKIGLFLHYCEEPLTNNSIASKLFDLIEKNNALYKENLAHQYAINARSGGAAKAANVVEDMFLLGHLDHLVPVTANVPYPASINLDLWMMFFCVLGLIFYLVCKIGCVLFSLVQPKVKTA